jgi:hypothetical protein
VFYFKANIDFTKLKIRNYAFSTQDLGFGGWERVLYSDQQSAISSQQGVISKTEYYCKDRGFPLRDWMNY